MEQISPLLKAQIEKQCNNDTKINNQPKSTDIGGAKLKTIQKDSFENSQIKKTKIKKAVIIGASISLLATALIALVKTRNLSKAKKELTALYDNIFAEFNKNTPDALNFEKPELVFKRLKAGQSGGYLTYKNQICIDPRDLRRTCILKDLKSTHTKDLSDDLKISIEKYKGSLFDIIKTGRSKDFRIATKNEALAVEGAVFSHELAHARQFQTLLSSKGGREKYIEYLKSNNKNLPEEALKKEAGFVFNYKPKQELPQNIKITEKLPEGSEFQYNMKHILDSFTNYNDKNLLEYYTNLTEVSARNSEYSYWNKVINGALPKPEGVSDEFLNSFKDKAEYNAKVLMKAISS